MYFCLNDSVPVSLICGFMWKSSLLGQLNIQTSGSQSSVDVASHFVAQKVGDIVTDLSS